MMPHEPILDVMRRTMDNLEFIQKNATINGPFEVTQLINSFLGALAHPWEKLNQNLSVISIQEAEQQGWPIPKSNDPKLAKPATLGDQIRLMRNGLAHGNIQFLSHPRGEISALRIKNFDRVHLTWDATLTVIDMEKFLRRFVSLVEEVAREARAPRKIA